MLHAFKSQLERLAVEEGAAFHKAVRKRSASKASRHRSGRLLSLIMMMPQLIARARDLSESARVPSRLKSLNGFLLTYLYHPIDFLADGSNGLFGYLDDAYFVGRVYQKLRENVDFTEAGLDPMRELPQALEAAREVLPAETRQIERLIEELEEGRRHLFDRLMRAAA